MAITREGDQVQDQVQTQVIVQGLVLGTHQTGGARYQDIGNFGGLRVLRHWEGTLKI